MSRRFRYLVLATTVSLGIWAGIIAGSLAVLNSLPVLAAYDASSVQGRIALHTQGVAVRGASDE
jgi:hypothetical protein